MRWWCAGRPALLEERTFTGTEVIRSAAIEAGSPRTSSTPRLELSTPSAAEVALPCMPCGPQISAPQGRGHRVATQPSPRATGVVGGRAFRTERPDVPPKVGRTKPHSARNAEWRLELPSDFAQDSQRILHGTPCPKRRCTQRARPREIGGLRSPFVAVAAVPTAVRSVRRLRFGWQISDACGARLTPLEQSPRSGQSPAPRHFADGMWRNRYPVMAESRSLDRSDATTGLSGSTPANEHDPRL
jgi:hypothetical protein